MLDLQFICDHLEEVAANCKNRGAKVDISPILSLRDSRREFITQGDALRKEQKETSAKIPKSSAEEKPALIARGKELRAEVAKVEEEQKEIEQQLYALQSQIPNMTHPDSPVGRLEEDSITVREVGTKPDFGFEPKDHVEIAEHLDLIDFESGSKVAGHGFYYLKNEAVLLELALVQYAIEKLVAEGFTVLTTPDVARDEVLEGIGYIPRGDETQIYSIENTDLSLVATAEITLGGMMKDEVLDFEKLPVKIAGISHCFRTEAGAHGRATRGIYRVHQFTKVEIFGFTAPDLEVSNEYHQMILRLEEEIFQGLGLPYRVLDICTGDMGGSSYRKYDLEAWMPGRGGYGEVTSCTNCTDYQARRLGTRCRTAGKKGTQFVHTLNGTAVAVTRAMIALLENNQQADGSVVIPKALQKWVGKEKIEAREVTT